jgi:hypothetical protein
MFISLDQISWRHATKSVSDPTSEFLEILKEHAERVGGRRLLNRPKE